MRLLLSMALLLGTIAGPVRAAGPPAAGDLLVGDGTSLVLVDPTAGTRAERGIATAAVRDVAVDPQWRLLALTTDGSIERFDPTAFGGDPAANRETVGALAGATGIALDGDGTLLVADGGGNRIVRVDPDAFQPGDPSANQSPVSSGGLLDGPLDVAIDLQLDVAYCTTSTRVVAIDLAADPGSNQQLVTANPFVWASLAVLADGRIAAAGPFGVARMDPAEMPPVSPSVVASGGELQEPTGLAVEAGGSLVVPEFSDGDVVRIFPDAFDPNDKPANQEIVSHFDLAPDLHGIAVVPEPGALAAASAALAALAGLARGRSQKRAALV
jgi:hypothetical protein